MVEKELLHKPNQLMSLKTEKKITAIQKKSYNIFLKNAQNLIKFKNHEDVLFKIECKELYEKAGIGKKDDNYLKEEIENLMRILVSIIDKDNPTDWETFPLLRYAKRKGEYYYYKLDENIIEALKHQEFFTPLNLMIIKSLSSQYSITLYELAIRYQKVRIPEMKIEEIRELTNTEGLYDRFFDFRINVLEKACKEISEKTDIKLSYETRRLGRKIGYINFNIQKKKEFEKSEIKETETAEKTYSEEVEMLYKKIKEIERIESLKDVIEESIEKYAIERVESNIKYSNKNAKSNYTAFFKKSLKEDYAKIEREKKKKKAEIKKKQEQLEEIKKKREEEEKKLTRELAEKIYETKTEEEKEEYLKNISNVVKKSNFFDKKEIIIAIIIEELEQLY